MAKQLINSVKTNFSKLWKFVRSGNRAKQSSSSRTRAQARQSTVPRQECRTHLGLMRMGVNASQRRWWGAGGKSGRSAATSSPDTEDILQKPRRQSAHSKQRFWDGAMYLFFFRCGVRKLVTGGNYDFQFFGIKRGTHIVLLRMVIRSAQRMLVAKNWVRNLQKMFLMNSYNSLYSANFLPNFLVTSTL